MEFGGGSDGISRGPVGVRRGSVRGPEGVRRGFTNTGGGFTNDGIYALCICRGNCKTPSVTWQVSWQKGSQPSRWCVHLLLLLSHTIVKYNVVLLLNVHHIQPMDRFCSVGCGATS
jgi:hypothetical protein